MGIAGRKSLAYFWVAAIAFIACLPGLADYVVEGMDINFHLARIEGIADGLAEGQFPVRLQFVQLNGYGYPVSICYGDLLLYFPAILRLSGLSLLDSYHVFILLLNIASAIVAYYAFRTIFRSRELGVLGCALWTLCPYHVVDFWMRAAVGESIALMAMPLLALGIYLVFTKDEKVASAKGRFGFIWLVVGGSIVVYSHVLSIMMCALLVVPAVIVGFFYNHSKRVIVQVASALIAWLLVCAAFFVPFLSYYLNHAVAIADVSADRISDYAFSHALQPAQLFLLPADFGSQGRSFVLSNGSAGEMPFTIGAAFMMIIALYVAKMLRGGGGLIAEIRICPVQRCSRSYGDEHLAISLVFGIAARSAGVSSGHACQYSISLAFNRFGLLMPNPCLFDYAQSRAENRSV